MDTPEDLEREGEAHLKAVGGVSFGYDDDEEEDYDVKFTLTAVNMEYDEGKDGYFVPAKFEHVTFDDYLPDDESEDDESESDVVEAPENLYVKPLFDLSSYTDPAATVPVGGKHASIANIALSLCGYDKDSGFKVVLSRVDVNDRLFSEEDQSECFFVAEIVNTANNKRVGKIQVSVDMEDYSAELDYIAIERPSRGNGFGTRWVEHFEQTMWDSGINRINLHANLDVGGYYWATLGYDFDRANLDYYKGRLAYEWESRYPDDPLDRETMREIRHSWDIARMVGHDGYKIGKKMMLGTDWFGVKYHPEMGEDGIGVGEEYYSAAREKQKQKVKA